MITCAFERYIENDFVLLWKFHSLERGQKMGLNQNYHYIRWKYSGNDAKIKKSVVNMLEKYVGDRLDLLSFNEIAKRLGIKEYQAKLAFESGMKKLKRKLVALEYEYRDLANTGF